MAPWSTASQTDRLKAVVQSEKRSGGRVRPNVSAVRGPIQSFAKGRTRQYH